MGPFTAQFLNTLVALDTETRGHHAYPPGGLVMLASGLATCLHVVIMQFQLENQAYLFFREMECRNGVA